MNQEHRFDIAAHALSSTFGSASEPERQVTRAQRLRTEATAPIVRSAFRATARLLRPCVAPVIRWRRRRETQHALMRCSDRTLADIGIAREHIRLVARGIDPAEYRLGDRARSRWWHAARARLHAAQLARQERRRIYRELMAYSDRELEEIGLRRADIPGIARQHPVLQAAE
jgi:uncharacterized protein YjiS (DUF1127 family)